MVFKKGGTPWNKNILLGPRSEEIKKKISDKNRGCTPWNKNMLLGPRSEEIKKKIGDKNRGKTHTPEQNLITSKTTKKAMADITIRQKISESKRGCISWNKGKKTPPTTRRLQSIAHIKFLSLNNSSKTNTNIERIIKLLLDEKKIGYVQQYNLGNLFSCDFYLPSINTIIECDGNYWHSLPKNIRRDKHKNWVANNNDYRLLRFSGKDLLSKKITLKIILDQNIRYFYYDFKNKGYSYSIESNSKEFFNTLNSLKEVIEKDNLKA